MGKFHSYTHVCATMLLSRWQFWFKRLKHTGAAWNTSVPEMPGCSPLQLAKRALVKVLLTLASKYGVALQVNRDSEDKVVLSAYKRVALKAHPDKGGTNED